MDIVPIQTTDINELQKLAIRTYTAAFGHKNDSGVLEKYFDTAFTKIELQRQLENTYSYWYFAKQNDNIAGYLKLNVQTAQTEFQEEKGLEIERIYIDIPFLSNGYGSKLINFSILKARELEKNYIWLGVWEENPEAIRFYKKHKFEIIGTHDYDMIAEIQTDFIMRRNV